MALGLDDVPMQRQRFLAKELIDTNQDLSLEDLRTALQKGRRGEYEMGFAKRNTLSLELLSGWVKTHRIERDKLIAYRRRMELMEKVEGEREDVLKQYDILKEVGPKPSKPKRNPLYEEFKKEYEAYRIRVSNNIRSDQGGQEGVSEGGRVPSGDNESDQDQA